MTTRQHNYPQTASILRHEYSYPTRSNSIAQATYANPGLRSYRVALWSSSQWVSRQPSVLSAVAVLKRFPSKPHGEQDTSLVIGFNLASSTRTRSQSRGQRRVARYFSGCDLGRVQSRTSGSVMLLGPFSLSCNFEISRTSKQGYRPPLSTGCQARLERRCSRPKIKRPQRIYSARSREY